jgi:hypothetical protein
MLMRRIAVSFIVLCLSITAQAAASEQCSLSDVENKLLAGDTKGAETEFMNSQMILRCGPAFHSKIQGEVGILIRYVDELNTFRKYAHEPGKEQQTVLSMNNLSWARTKIPADLHFSEKVTEFIAAADKETQTSYAIAKGIITQREDAAKRGQEEARARNEAEHQAHIKEIELQEAEYEAAIAEQKQICGKDYGEIRVGMTLSRVTQCVGEFDLSGQVKKNGVTLSKYYRDRTYLYVKNGKIVAWDRY